MPSFLATASNRAFRCGKSRLIAFSQMSMPHRPLAAIIGQFVGMATEEGCNLRLDGLRQQRSRTAVQHLGQLLGECP